MFAMDFEIIKLGRLTSRAVDFSRPSDDILNINCIIFILVLLIL